MSDGSLFRAILMLFIGVLIGHEIYRAGRVSGAEEQKKFDALQKENQRLNHVRIFQFCPEGRENPPLAEEKERLLKL